MFSGCSAPSRRPASRRNLTCWDTIRSLRQLPRRHEGSSTISSPATTTEAVEMSVRAARSEENRRRSPLR